MSIQSDNEFLAIQALEIYSEQNHLSTETVYDLFHKHQIFEKMMLQYEYLHQISSEEIMEYIDTEINKDTHDLIVFHGTCTDFTEVRLDKSHNRRDFGKGFYTTILEQQAKEWGYRLSLRERKESYYVLQFVFNENDSLKIKRFGSLNKDWLEFVKENRSKGGLQHDYDVVIGPVADDNTMETVQLYIAGVLSADEAVARLRYSNINNQVSFHTEKALLNLNLIGRESYGCSVHI